MDTGKCVRVWRLGWASFLYHEGGSDFSKTKWTPHTSPLLVWKGELGRNLGSRKISGALLIHPGQFVIDSFVCLAKPSPGWTNWNQFFSPHLLWVPGGYGHPGICRETLLNKFQAAFVLGACPSQLLSAPSAAFAFCAAFHWWCQGWLHLLSLSLCVVPYAWNILLALSQETTFFLPPSVKLISSTTPIRWADTG